MALGHEKLDVYHLAIGYVAWVYEKAARLEGVHCAARDQWLRVAMPEMNSEALDFRVV